MLDGSQKYLKPTISQDLIFPLKILKDRGLISGRGRGRDNIWDQSNSWYVESSLVYHNLSYSRYNIRFHFCHNLVTSS